MEWYKNRKTGLIIKWDREEEAIHVEGGGTISGIKLIDTSIWILATFISQDGVPLFAGDKFWLVDEKYLRISEYKNFKTGVSRDWFIVKDGEYSPGYERKNSIFAARSAALRYLKNLKELRRQEHVVFTTYDGVDLYPGDSYWWLSSNNFTVIRGIVISNNKLNKLNRSSITKCFSTPELAHKQADDWLQPQFSKADILSAWKDRAAGMNSRLFQRIMATKDKKGERSNLGL